MTGDDCLRPLPLISSADSIDLRRWSSPNALQRIVTGFAEELRHACLLQNELVAIDRKFAPRFPLPFFQRFNPIVKSIDCDAALTIMKCGEQLRQGCDRILDGASENTRMQIHLWAGNFNLEGGHPPQAVTQRRHTLLNHSGDRKSV